jgi:tellurite resistance protein TerC
MVWLWILMTAVMALLLGLDLFVLNRRPERIGPAEAVGWAFFWFALAGACNGALWFMHTHDLLGLRAATGLHADEAAQQFLAAFLTESALGLDTVFVLSAVFAHRRTPERVQHRVLFYGLLVALPVRGLLIGSIGGLVNTWHWTRIAFGVLLVLAALRMILVRQENTDPEKNLFVRLTQKALPMTDRHIGTSLVTREKGRWAWTPLMGVLLLVETADVIFAFDSVPAAFAMTDSPFIVFSGNCFALLCLRSLFFALRGLTAWIRYVKLGLAAILAYCAVTIALPAEGRPHSYVSLAFIASALVAGFGAALIFPKRGPVPTVSPLGEDAERIARLTLRQARKLIVLVVGFTVVGLGILMLIGPGPGLLVVPIGLAVLASEFVWARRLLNHYTERATKMGKRAGNALAQRSHPWLIAPVIGGTIAGIWAIIHFGWLAPKLILPGSVPLLIGEAVWAVLTVHRHRELKRRRMNPTAPVPEVKPSESSAA